ncbi:IS4 family transposase [Spirochaetia bacterium]|nr:IS4 family transposase [Spirochaetia bacterium]
MVRNSRVVMQKIDTWKEQISFYRFFNNPKVKEETLADCVIEHCVESCEGLEEVLLIEDTTELNLTNHQNRLSDRKGLGILGNQFERVGFFCHPTLAVNPQDLSLMGALDIDLFTRDPDAERISERKKKFEDKESYRWAERAIQAKERLRGNQRAIAVQDREGDIYESFCVLMKNGVDFVIRSNHDRQIQREKGEKERLRGHLEATSPEYAFEMAVTGNNKSRKKRTAQLSVQFERVFLKKPLGIPGKTRGKYPVVLPVSVVRVKEKPETVPPDEEPANLRFDEWLLYSSRPVETVEQALGVVEYYKARWIIEDLFRTVKKEGVNYEETELETGTALRKLFVLAFYAAMILLQLRQARNGTTRQKLSLVFSEEQVTCLEDILPRFEGKTEKLKNPYPKDNLAWAAWIIARLGGWKGYSSQRPPGVITLHDGWLRFHLLYEGWAIAKDVYKR